MKLRDKISIVTGAAHGIGKAIAEAFAAEGAAVLVVDIDETGGEATAAEIRARGQAASFLKCDVADEKQAEAVVKIAGSKSGRIDVLCNNAAYLGAWHDIERATPDEWEKCISIALMG